MTQKELLHKLSELKPKLRQEGFEILGIFGSYARGEQTSGSDVDILYTLNEPKRFTKVNGGFGAFSKIRQTKEYLQDQLGAKVDFVDRSSLAITGKRYIFNNSVNVC